MVIFNSYVKLPEDIYCNRWNCLCTEASAALGSPKSKTASTANLGTTLGTPAVHDLRSKKYQKIWANCIKMHKKKLPFCSWYHPWLTRWGQGMASGQLRRARRSAVPPFRPELLTFQARRQCPWSTMEPWWNRWNRWNQTTIASVHIILIFQTHIILISQFEFASKLSEFIATEGKSWVTLQVSRGAAVMRL